MSRDLGMVDHQRYTNPSPRMSVFEHTVDIPEIEHLCSSKYRVRCHQGFYLVYRSLIHKIVNHDECDLSPELEVDHLIHVYDPTVPSNRQITDFLEDLVILPKPLDNPSLGILLTERTYSKTHNSHDKAFIIGNLVSFADAKTLQEGPCDCRHSERFSNSRFWLNGRIQRVEHRDMRCHMRCEYLGESSITKQFGQAPGEYFMGPAPHQSPFLEELSLFSDPIVKEALDQWPFGNLETDSPKPSPAALLLQDIWETCFASNEALSLLDESLNHVDPVTREITHQISELIHFLKDDVSKLPVDIPPETKMPLTDDTVLEYCLKNGLSIPFRKWIHDWNELSYIRYSGNVRPWGVYEDPSDKIDKTKACTIDQYFMILRENVNLCKMQIFTMDYLKMRTDSDFYKQDLLNIWLGREYSVDDLLKGVSDSRHRGHFHKDEFHKLIYMNNLIFAVVFSTNPLQAKPKIQEFNLGRTRIVRGVRSRSRKQLPSPYQPPNVPTLKEWSRATIRQQLLLSTGYSILPVITGFAQSSILPRYLIEYVFLYNEIVSVYPEMIDPLDSVFSFK